MSGIFENNDLKDYSIKSDYQFELTSNSQLQFGAFATLYDVKYSYAQSDTVTILNRNANAILGEDIFRLGQSSLTTGFRSFPVKADYFETTRRYILNLVLPYPLIYR